MNVVDLAAERKKRDMEKQDQRDPHYQALINRMNKYELLEEMVRFQEERSALDEMSFSMMVRGKILFRALELQAETEELRILSSSYRRHLEHEIEHYLSKTC